MVIGCGRGISGMANKLIKTNISGLQCAVEWIKPHFTCGTKRGGGGSTYSTDEGPTCAMHYVPDLPEDLLCPLPTLCLCTQRVPCLRLSAMNAPMQERGTSRANVHRDRGAAAGEGARCLVTADMGVVPHQGCTLAPIRPKHGGGGGDLRRARTARSRCGEYTRNVLSVIPLPKGPLGRANAF